MLHKDDVKIRQPQNRQPGTDKPPHCDDFKACLKKTMKILEERYKV